MAQEYVLLGSGFDSIPGDAVGVTAADNNDPLAGKDNDSPGWLYEIQTKNDNQIVLHQVAEATHNIPTYLGAIVSADRQTVYWTNDTEPLP